MKQGVDGTGPYVRIICRGRMGDDRDSAGFGADGQQLCHGVGGQQIACAQVLRVQDAVHGLERKLTAAVEKVGEVGLTEAGLAREQRHAQGAPLNSANQFKTEPFMHLGHVHVWKVHQQQWRR